MVNEPPPVPKIADDQPITRAPARVAEFLVRHLAAGLGLSPGSARRSPGRNTDDLL